MNSANNNPDLWLAHFPVPQPHMHKYSRGCLMLFAGRMTGAGRLAARAAQRVGAGIVHVVVPADFLPIYAIDLVSCIVRTDPCDVALGEERASAYLIGPGLEVGEEARHKVLAVLAKQKPTVLDAGALTSFAGNPQLLLSNLHAQVVLTPHAGEFERLFGTQTLLRAAQSSGANIVLKGNSTQIMSFAGEQIINAAAPADLASAGTGDVLAGLVAGLLAQGMPPFFASAAAVWLHTECAKRVGAGLIAEDLERELPTVLSEIRKLKA